MAYKVDPAADYRAVREQVNGCCFAIVASLLLWALIMFALLHLSEIASGLTDAWHFLGVYS